MLANEIEDKNEETEENNGCNVFSVAVAGNNAVISFETIVDATLLVAIYNESCDTLIATGTTEVKRVKPRGMLPLIPKICHSIFM